MAYTHADIVSTVQSVDGKKKLEFLKRHDGLFEFREDVLTTVDDYSGPEEIWMPGYSSGLFQTLGEAHGEADKAIGWLRDA